MLNWPELLVAALFAVLIVAAGATSLLTRHIESRFPPEGRFAEIDGVTIHYIDVAAGDSADLLAMVFIHGASGNARDLYGAFGESLAGRGRMIFVDRPGAGYSGRAGTGDATLKAQAGYVAGLIEQLGTGPAIIIGHSLGGAVAAAVAVHHPDKVAGLVFLAPASHPWPGYALSWYTRLANLPVVGPLFAHTLAVPLGNLLYPAAVKEAFSPDKPPRDYGQRSATRLVLRPANFLANAADLHQLKDNVRALSSRYGEIGAPTVIISGDADNTVDAELHSRGLERDIADARLVWLAGAGHMASYSATETVIAEIAALNRRIAARTGNITVAS